MSHDENDPADFADEPTDPGFDTANQPGDHHFGAPVGHNEPSDAVNSLGFKPQTAAFAAVTGPPTPDANNPFGTPQSQPNYENRPSQPSAPASGSFTPPMVNPTGSFNVNTGEFSAGQAAPPAAADATGQQTFQAPAPAQNQGFAPPMTGGFQAVPGPQQQGQQHSGQQQQYGQQQPGQHYLAPQTGQHAPVGQTGSFPGVGPGNPGTGAFQQVGPNQSLQIGEYVDGPPEPTIKIRAAFGAGGLLFGSIVGLALGLLNSVFEGVGILEGMRVTIQISIWFGGMIALIAAWKPDKVWETLESYGFFD